MEIIVDEKVTVWVRRTCDAGDLSQKEIIKAIKDGTIFNIVEVIEDNSLTETEETLSPKDNGGEPTIEYMVKREGRYECISDNVCIGNQNGN